MSRFRVALANLRYPATPEESVRKAVDAIGRLARRDRPASLVAAPDQIPSQ